MSLRDVYGRKRKEMLVPKIQEIPTPTPTNVDFSDPLLTMAGTLAGRAAGTAVGGPVGGEIGASLGGQIAGKGTVDLEKTALDSASGAGGDLLTESTSEFLSDALKEEKRKFRFFSEGGKVEVDDAYCILNPNDPKCLNRISSNSDEVKSNTISGIQPSSGPYMNTAWGLYSYGQNAPFFAPGKIAADVIGGAMLDTQIEKMSDSFDALDTLSETVSDNEGNVSQSMSEEDVDSMDNSYSIGGKIKNMKNIKKLSQADRYGNSFSVEFDIPPMQDIPHPGKPKGTDTVPAWLTPGERVMNAEAERMFGPELYAMNEAGRAVQAAQGGTIPEYAAGGCKVKYSAKGSKTSCDCPECSRTVYAAEGEKVTRKPSALDYEQAQIDNAFKYLFESYPMQAANYIRDILSGGGTIDEDNVPYWFREGYTDRPVDQYESRRYKEIPPDYKSNGGPVYLQGGGRPDEWFYDPRMLDAIRQVESGGNPNAVSKAGAIGPYQIMPATAANPGYGLAPIAQEDLTDEKKSREFAMNYLAALQARNPELSPEQILQMYNAGENRIRKELAGTGTKPLEQETIDYGQKVLKEFGSGKPIPFSQVVDEAIVRGANQAIEAVKPLTVPGDRPFPEIVDEKIVETIPKIKEGISSAWEYLTTPQEVPLTTEIDNALFGQEDNIPPVNRDIPFYEDEGLRQLRKSEVTDNQDRIDAMTNLVNQQDETIPEPYPFGEPSKDVPDNYQERVDAMTQLMAQQDEEDAVAEPFGTDEKVAIGDDLIISEEDLKDSSGEIVSPVISPEEKLPGGEPFKLVWDKGSELIKKDPTAWEKVKDYFSGASKDPAAFFGKLGADALEVVADSGVIDKKLIANAAVMYLGSRLFGYGHEDSGAFASKFYVNGLQTKQKAEAEAKSRAAEFSLEMKKEKYLQDRLDSRERLKEAGKDRRDTAKNTLDALIKNKQFSINERQLRINAKAQNLDVQEYLLDQQDKVMADAIDLMKEYENMGIDQALAIVGPKYGFNVSGVSQPQEGFTRKTSKEEDKKLQTFFRVDPFNNNETGPTFVEAYQKGDGWFYKDKSGQERKLNRNKYNKFSEDVSQFNEVVRGISSSVADGLGREYKIYGLDSTGQKTVEKGNKFNAQAMTANFASYLDKKFGDRSRNYLLTDEGQARLHALGRQAVNYYDKTGTPIRNFEGFFRMVDAGLIDMDYNYAMFEDPKTNKKPTDLKLANDKVLAPLDKYTKEMQSKGSQLTSGQQAQRILDLYQVDDVASYIKDNTNLYNPADFTPDKIKEVEKFISDFKTKGTKIKGLSPEMSFLSAWINSKN